MRNAITRRHVLAGAGASCLGSRAWAAMSGFPDAATLMVADAQGGRVERLAAVLAPALGRALQQAGPAAVEAVGGADGITGANQFEARAAPDGSNVLLVPGGAAIAWLIGESRVRFDAARWVTIWAETRPAALISRAALKPGGTIRFGVPGMGGPELAALLALDLMGVNVVPITLERAATQAMQRPDIDAVFLRGAALRRGADAFAARGWSAGFSLGALNGAGEVVRDIALPNLPTAHELLSRPGRDTARELRQAFHAVCAASQLDVALVLPQLTPASLVAWWRRACSGLGESPEILREAEDVFARPLLPTLAAATIDAVTVEAASLLTLRRWLAERHGWRPT